MRRVLTRRRLLVAVLALLAGAGLALAAVSALASGGSRTSAGAHTSTAATSLATVQERSLSSQTQASGTLGYAHPSTVVNLTGGGQSSEPSSPAGTAVYTMLPAAGDTIRHGHALYAVNDQPVLLLYGSAPAWRPFQSGMAAGRDVAELNANLRTLGYGNPSGNEFSVATEDAILKLQAAHGLAQTGSLPLGSIVFEPGAVRVTSIQATLGGPAQPGPVLGVTSTRHQVTVQLDPSQQAAVKPGDRVTVTLLTEQTTPAVITKVGTVAQSASSDAASSASGSQNSSPTIEVDLRLLHEKAAGNLDQAPVQVAITTAAVNHALVVPVSALLARAGGGYAVQTVDAAGIERLVPVQLGLFDDADGLVQVTGARLHAGQRVLVPTT